MKALMETIFSRSGARRLQVAMFSVGLLLLGVVCANAVTLDLEAILNSIDRRRNFEDTDFSAVMTMIRENVEDGVSKRVVQQFRRDSADQFLMLILEPEDRKGQGYLRVEDNMWVYDPISRKFSHSSLKERFENTDARNSDFRRSTTADDYDIADVTEGKLGKYEVYILKLAAKNDEVTFPFKTIYVTKSNYLVLKTEDYSLTKRLMRTSLYPKYAKIGEQYVATTSIFVDELTEGNKTQISISDISVEKLPDYVFTKAYVERVNR